jgi:aminoglycoside/choline kinase family phosphotransferase
MYTKEIIDKLLQRAKFESWGAFQVTELGAQASGRKYYRIQNLGQNKPRTALLMARDGSVSGEITGSKQPGSESTNLSCEIPFLEVWKTLNEDAPLPEIYAYTDDQLYFLLQDLGDQTFEAWIQPLSLEHKVTAYQEAIDVLIGLQGVASKRTDPKVIFRRRAFDFDLLYKEFLHWDEWGLKSYYGAEPSTHENQVLDQGYRWITQQILDSPREFVHRDYQSRNLMRCDAQLYVIDFQDALMGSAAYDLVALIRDSYIVLPPQTVEKLIDYYVTQRASLGRPVPKNFRNLFYLQTMQRKMKDAGRFEFIDKVRGNPDFLKHIPDTVPYFIDALKKVDAPALKEFTEITLKYIESKPSTEIRGTH